MFLNYLQVIAEKHGDENILGLHFLGPNAGEVVQGFSVALRYVNPIVEMQLFHGISIEIMA